MSSSTKLASIIEPSPESRDIIEQTALFISRMGLELESILLARYENEYKFLRSSDPFHAFYQLKLTDHLAENQAAQPEYLEPPSLEELLERETLENLDFPSWRDPDFPPWSDRGYIRGYDLPPSPRNLLFTFPQGITVKELCIIKLTAQFMVRYGVYFGRDLIDSKDPRFDFMQDGRIDFLNGLIRAYAKVLKTAAILKSKSCTPTALKCFFQRLQLEKLEQGDKMAIIDIQALVSGVDCFAHMEDSNYSAIMPRPEHLSTHVGSQLTDWYQSRNQDGAHDAQADLEPPSLRDLLGSPCKLGITLKELCIMKLTAQFLVRYGMHFWQDLLKRVVTNPWFGFVNSDGRGNHVFTLLVAAYEKVVEHSFKSRRSDACTATVLECFFHRLQLEKLEEGDEMTIIDLHAFVSGVDCFALMEDDEPTNRNAASTGISVSSCTTAST